MSFHLAIFHLTSSHGLNCYNLDFFFFFLPDHHSHHSTVSKGSTRSLAEELQEIILPCLGYCARKGVSSISSYDDLLSILPLCIESNICYSIYIYSVCVYIHYPIFHYRSQQRKWSSMTLTFQVQLSIILSKTTSAMLSLVLPTAMLLQGLSVALYL